MSFIDRHRWLRFGLIFAIALSLIAMVCVDVAVAQQRREHDRKVAAARAERKAERAYLAALTPVAKAAYVAVAPVGDVLSAMNYAFLDDVFSARDALARGQSLADLLAASKQLHALKVPPGIREQAGKVTDSFDSMRESLTDLASHGTIDDFDALNTEMSGGSSSEFLGAQINFVDAVVEAYARQHVPPPFTTTSDGPKPQPTSTAWIFAADNACTAATVTLYPTIKLEKSKSLADYRRYLKLWSTALGTLATTLAKLHPPVGAGALPGTLAGRLPIIKANAGIIAAQLQAVDRRDPVAFDAADERLHALLPRLAQLGRAMRAYGAVFCGRIIGSWAGDKSAAKPGSGSGVTQT